MSVGNAPIVLAGLPMPMQQPLHFNPAMITGGDGAPGAPGDPNKPFEKNETFFPGGPVIGSDTKGILEGNSPGSARQSHSRPDAPSDAADGGTFSPNPAIRNNASSPPQTTQGVSGTQPADTQPADTQPAGPSTAAPPVTTLQGRDPDLIYAGEKIKLPDGTTYTVRSGDTLSGIARNHGVSLASVMKLNGFNEQLLDVYKNGQLVEARRVGDPLPVTPGGSTPTAPVPPAASTGAPQPTASASVPEPVTEQNVREFPARQLLDLLNSGKGEIENRDQLLEILNRLVKDDPKITMKDIAVLNQYVKDHGLPSRGLAPGPNTSGNPALA